MFGSLATLRPISQSIEERRKLAPLGSGSIESPLTRSEPTILARRAGVNAPRAYAQSVRAGFVPESVDPRRRAPYHSPQIASAGDLRHGGDLVEPFGRSRGVPASDQQRLDHLEELSTVQAHVCAQPRGQ